jgi:hypothetical protein
MLGRPFITTATVTIIIIVTAGGAMVAGSAAGNNIALPKAPGAFARGFFFAIEPHE